MEFFHRPPNSRPVSYSLLRYLLYDVNPPEGFNLRRDVYIRVASLLKTLLKTEEWVLVLPPWGRLYHWQSPDIHQVRIPWSEFFDLPSLNKNIPVIEYEQFIAGEAGIRLGAFLMRMSGVLAQSRRHFPLSQAVLPQWFL